jgi:hypothetical protein
MLEESKKRKNSLNLVCMLILCAAIQHVHRSYFEFIIVIVAEGGTLFNLFLRKKLFIRFFIALLEAIFLKQ